MMYKYDVGDLVFMSNPTSPTNAGILHIVGREFKRWDYLFFPAKYYHGFAFGLAKDENSGLYVPLHCFENSAFCNETSIVWSTNNKESDLGVINSKKVDLEKLLPFVKFQSNPDYQRYLKIRNK